MAEEIEIWKDVVGYEGYYQVSTLGNIRSLDVVNEFLGRWGSIVKRPKKGLVLKFNKTTSGYLSVYLCIKAVKRKIMVHRIVALNFLPNLENKQQVNHIDFNKLNNSVSNLEWTTPLENVAHFNLTGKVNHAKGEKASRVFKNEDILSIRARLQNGEKGARIAREYKVTKSTIYTIKNRRSWSHI